MTRIRRIKPAVFSFMFVMAVLVQIIMPVSVNAANLTQVVTGIVSPSCIAVDSSGVIYVGSGAGSQNGKISKVDPITHSIEDIYTGIKLGPYSIAVDSSGNIYYTAANSGKVYRTDETSAQACANGGGAVIGGLAVDSSDNVYATALRPLWTAGTSVIKLAPSDFTATPSPTVYNPTDLPLSSPTGVDIDSYGNIIVADQDHKAVKKLDPASDTVIGIYTDPSIISPKLLAVAPDNSIYVVNKTSQQVTELSSTGTFVKNYTGIIGWVNGIAVDANGTVYILTATGDVDILETKNTDAALSNLSVAGQTVSNFSSAAATYNVELPYGTTAVPVVTAMPTDSANAHAVVTDAAELPGSTTVLVTAQDGITTKTYTINFIVAPPPLSSDATLTSVLGQPVSAGPEAGTSGAPKTVSISVANGVAAVEAGNIVQHDAAATVTFYGTDSTFTNPEAGSVALTAGSGTNVYIKATAEDGSKTYYKVTINRAAPPVNEIAAAGVTGIAAPTAGSAPIGAGSLTVEEGIYTVTGLIWKNSDGTTPASLTALGKFKAGTIYKAEIELTAVEGNKFQSGGFTPTVNTGTSGAGNVNGGDVSGNKLTFTVTFLATSAQSVNSIALKTQPNKLIYIEGETIDLTGLAVTLTYNDGTTADVAYADFGSNNIKAGPDNGTVLTIAGYNGKPVTLTCNTHTANTENLTVNAFLSSDATLTSVLGQPVSAGPEAGTSGAPKTKSINVANGVATVAAGDIIKNDAGAVVTFYGTDNTFATSEAGSVSLTAGSGTNVYIKVVAADNITIIYYKVAINRASATTSRDGGGSSTPAPQPPQPSEVTGSVIDENTGSHVSDIKAIIITDNNGNKTISMDAGQTVVLKELDGNASKLVDTTKVNIASDTGDKVPILSDGTIKIEGLKNGTDKSLEISYDLGNGQKIVIGTMKIKIDENGKTDITTTLIDPYGIITDSKTGKAIDGVNLTLYYADTERNRASGKIPGAIVQLPLIDGFKPNNNKNPQTSGASGAYGFMVFPNSDYYIVAEEDGYNKYTSPMFSVEKELIKWNFKMHQTGAERLSGSDRVDTSIEIAKAIFANNITNVVLATSENYPDALSGSVFAKKLNAPILLIGSADDSQKKVLEYLKEYANPQGKIYILGGTGAVSADIEEKIKGAGFENIDRIGGKDRYETSVNIAEKAGIDPGMPVILASGDNYPDALSVSNVAAIKGYPILLVGKDRIPDAIKDEILKIKPEKIYIIGLQGAVSTAVEKEAAEISSIDKVNLMRIGGIDRYETSLEIAKYFNLSGNAICAATGNNYPDALTGSVYAAKNNAPIILVDKTLSGNQEVYLKNVKPSNISIFGGEAVVSIDIMEKLSQLLGNK